MRRDHARTLAEYEQHLRRRNLARGTRENLLGGARRLLRALPRPLRRITRQDVRVFLAARALVLGPATLVAEASRVRRLLAWAAAEGRAPVGLADGLVVKAPPRHVRPILPERAVAALLGAASADPHLALALRDRALLELLYGLGLRASEARAVLVVDLDLAEGTVRVRPVKRGPPRVLPLPRAALPHLARYLREGRPRLARARGRDRGHLLLGATGAPLCRHGPRRIVARVAARAEVGRVQPHDVRRALATHLVARGVSVLAVADLLGHADLGAAEAYIGCNELVLRGAVERLLGNR